MVLWFEQKENLYNWIALGEVVADTFITLFFEQRKKRKSDNSLFLNVEGKWQLFLEIKCIILFFFVKIV